MVLLHIYYEDVKWVNWPLKILVGGFMARKGDNSTNSYRVQLMGIELIVKVVW